MTALVAVVAGHVQVPVALLRTVPGQMAALVAVVTARVIGRQAAVASNVAASVTTVAPVQILLAVTCKVSHLVAFVALLAASTATTAAATTTASELPALAAGSTGTATSTTTSSTNVLAVAGIVTRPVALEARISRHYSSALL